MSKTNKAEKSVGKPQWGTEAWIKAHPWSKMDKDRRYRVSKLLKIGKEGKVFLNEHDTIIRNIVEATKARLPRMGMGLCSKDADRVEKAVAVLTDFMVSTRDMMVANALRYEWELVCDGNCTTHTKQGKCSCKGKCAKVKGRKKDA